MDDLWNTENAPMDVLPDNNSTVAQCHEIMRKGALYQCNGIIPQGKCCCCEFDSVLGNWIGLVPDEKTFISKGNTTNWEFGNKGDIDTLFCDRHGHHCTNKPLDCKMYPLFPKEVLITNGLVTVHLIAGFPKCPLHSLDIPDHIKRVSTVAFLLYSAGFSDWMCKTAEGYKGYNAELMCMLTSQEITNILSDC